MDVRNVVENSQEHIIDNWCMVREANCDRTFTVRPYRCLGKFCSILNRVFKSILNALQLVIRFNVSVLGASMIMLLFVEGINIPLSLDNKVADFIPLKCVKSSQLYMLYLLLKLYTMVQNTKININTCKERESRGLAHYENKPYRLRVPACFFIDLED